MKALAHTLRACAAIPGLALLAACGSGGGGATIPVAGATPSTAPSTAPMGPLVTIPIHGMTPTAMAYQSGTSGAWTVVKPASGSASFNLAVGATAYSVAAVCPFNAVAPNTTRSGPAEVIVEATTADSPSLLCEPSGSTATVNATLFVELPGFPNTDTYSIAQTVPGLQLGPSFSGTVTSIDATGSPLWVSGPSDVVATVKNGSTVVAASLTRNVTFTDNGTVTLDPVGVNTSAVTSSNLTLPVGAAFGWCFFAPAEGGAASLVNGSTSPLSVPTIPGTGAGDYYYAFTSAIAGGNFVFDEATATTPSSIPLALPAGGFTLTGATNSGGDLPTANVAFGGFTVTGTRIYTLMMSWAETAQPAANGAPVLQVAATQSYLGTSTTVAVPNLGSVAGMLPNPTGSAAVAVLGQDWVASGGVPWDSINSSNSPSYAVPVSGLQAQYTQSNYFNYTAP